MMKRIIGSILVMALIVSGWPLQSSVSADNGHTYVREYADIYVQGGGKILNAKDVGSSLSSSYGTGASYNRNANSFGMFINGTAGTSWRLSDLITPGGSLGDNTMTMPNGSLGGFFEGHITVSQIPELVRLAQGGAAYFKVVAAGESNIQFSIQINGTVRSDISNQNINSAWLKFEANDTISIRLQSASRSKVNNIGLYFADVQEPTLQDVVLTHNGAIRYNADPAVQKNELFLKGNSWINMELKFSESVYPYYAEDASDRLDGAYNFLRTEIFNNPGGNGLDPATYMLSNVDNNYKSFTAGSLNLRNHSRTSFNLKYTAADNDSSNNIPLDPERLIGPADDERPTLLQRINEANFIDGAGNPLITVSSLNNLPFANNEHPEGAYRTFIDARPPGYSAVSNGIQPDILTGLTLNHQKQIRFKANLNEKVSNAKSPIEGTQIVFTNGMKAVYESGADTDQWTFVATVPDGREVETATLNTSALGHSSTSGDGTALWDYAHNLLTESIPSIAWADLSIDNTAPTIEFAYQNENEEEVPGGQYLRDGSFIVRASDPDLAGQASKGLYRQGNGSGLVYYVISRSNTDPFAGKEADNLAAIKRYSLALKQPSEELYPDEFEDLVLGLAENGTTIALPPEAKEHNGSWYLHTWVADMTWDSSRQLMQYEKGSVQRAQYVADNPNSTQAEIENHYREHILPHLAEYDNIDQWPLSDFKNDDSNWSYGVAEIKIDTDKPVVTGGDVVDNYTDNVFVTITATDPTSSIKGQKIEYQFVKEGNQPDADAWLDASLDQNGQVRVNTLGDPNIDKGGKYELYARAIDEAGNETIASLLTVDVLVIFHKFQTYSDDYSINEGPEFTIAGVPVDTIEYQITQTSDRPQQGSQWLAFEGEPEDAVLNDEPGIKVAFPADTSINGVLYAHVKVKQENINRYYYYKQEYKFDHLPPNVTFDSEQYLYPLPEQSVMIGVTDTMVDLMGVADSNIKYQWVKVTDDGQEQVPDEQSPNWERIPANKDIKLSVDRRTDDGNYRLYVYAQDRLGNGKVYHTSGLFAVYLLNDEPPQGSAGLIKVEPAGANAYEAILKLEVDVPSQVGYFYSISSNGGANWSTWRPFTNYVGVPVDTNDTDELKNSIKVKFKGYYGTNISEIYTPSVNLQNAPAYALASLEQIQPVRGGANQADGGHNDGLEIIFDHTQGKTITPTLANPETPELVIANERYRIYQNGTYSFNVRDGGKSEVVFIVVSNFDNEEPQVQVKYSTLDPTNGSVTVSLKANEPIRITNLATSSKIFKDNGEFTFEYEDAVGFKGEKTAYVGNIDKTPPEADLVLHYNDSDLRALISFEGDQVVVDSSGDGYDEQGVFRHYAAPTESNVIATNRIVAEIRPKSGAQADYKVVKNSAGDTGSTIVVSSNKKPSFTIADGAGNITVIKSSNLATLVTSVPKVEQTLMQRIDDEGNPVLDDALVTIDGVTYSKGKMRVTLELEESNTIAGNTITIGSQEISTFSRDYSGNQQASLTLTDRIGNRRVHTFAIEGLDNEAPKIQLNESSISIVRNKPNFNLATDLGGYTVSDNVSAAEDISVSIVERVMAAGGQYEDQPFDLSKTGKHLVKFIARDQVGNEGYATMTVYVQATDGLFVTANGLPLSQTASDTAIVDRAAVTFNVRNYNVIRTNNGESQAINEAGTFELLYYSGLVREGQMKYIAKKLTYEELVAGEFTVTFPKAGWYTIVIRTSERDRVFATLMVSKLQ